jgi:nitric oxide reductase NorQ protein
MATTPSTPGAQKVADLLGKFSAGEPVAAPAATTPAPAAAPVKPKGAAISFPRPNGELYFPRIVDSSDGTHDVDLLLKARGETLRDNLYVLFYGLPGTGKTACVDAAFPNLVTLSGDVDTTTDDFLGSWVQNPDGTYEWVDGPLIVAAEGDGVNGFPFFIDEVALIDPGVMSVVYALMDGRDQVRIKANPARGIVKARPGFYVVGACNPNAPGAKMSEALLSRFLIQVEATTDYDLAKTIGVPSKAVTVAKNLETKRASGEVSWSPQMRELLAFKRTSERFSQNLAVANLIGVAPEDDRAIVADVVSRAFGAAVANLRQGVAA